jgi:NADH:ubiquinone oxidoreductase subunit 6 (subunit J)
MIMDVPSLIVFAAVSAFTIGSAVSIFILKRLLHAVVALTFVFVGSALVFLDLGQTLFALLLLLVFIGGISTYLIVAVATEEKKAGIISIPAFFLLVFVFALVVSFFTFQGLSQNENAAQALDLSQTVATALQTQYLLLYFMVLLLFSSAIGGLLVIKKFTKLLI